MSLFEEIWYDDSYSKLPQSYRRDNIDALFYYIKGSNKSPSANKEAAERSYYNNIGIIFLRQPLLEDLVVVALIAKHFLADTHGKALLRIIVLTTALHDSLCIVCPENDRGRRIKLNLLNESANIIVVQKVLEHIKPQTFEFELKPIDINQRLFEVLTGVPGKTTIQFDATKKSEPAKKSVDKEKEESEPHSCQWIPKDE